MKTLGKNMNVSGGNPGLQYRQTQITMLAQKCTPPDALKESDFISIAKHCPKRNKPSKRYLAGCISFRRRGGNVRQQYRLMPPCRLNEIHLNDSG
jgi:hypothetical protein